MNPAVQRVTIDRVGPGASERCVDVTAVEEPLEIRLGGQPFAVIMRTPGADQALAAGFLMAEQIVRHPADIASMRYCTDAVAPSGMGPGPSSPGDEPSEPEEGNVLTVWLTGDAAVRAAQAVAGKRHVTASSSCGVCGRRSIDDLLAGVRPIAGSFRVARAVVSAMPGRLRAAQRAFDETGGLHAAALFDDTGTLQDTAEDVGRHNAVDKVLGRALLAGRIPVSDAILFVSGRTSFEIVQKAAVAGVPVVASVSAPSSLAVHLAQEAHVTLVGFVRGDTFNVYSVPERITP